MHFLRLLLIPVFACGVAGAELPNLLTNGDFEAGAAGWPQPAGATIEAEGANHFLRLKSSSPGQTVNVYRQVAVAGMATLQLTFRTRHSDVKRGTQPWFDARVILDFKDATGKVIKGAPGHPFFTGSSDGWKEKSLRFDVPSGATIFSVMPSLFQPESGTLDIDDIVLTDVSAR